MTRTLAFGLTLLVPAVLSAQARPRGRALGIPFEGRTGPENAITDVAGVAVGHVTLISGEGKLVPGRGPIRTGVTAILTRPRGDWDPVFAATFNQNGNGDMTGINWVKESGFLEGPILITGTHSVGTVRDAAIQWEIQAGREFVFTYPLVAETFDFLNDANGQHVKPEHAIAALEAARPGPVTEGAVGGGTGMSCNGFKGGIGTSSRVLEAEQGGYTVGVLVQCNYGGDLHILGVPGGTGDHRPSGVHDPAPAPDPALDPGIRPCDGNGGGAGDAGAEAPGEDPTGRGSIIVIVATDAPLLPASARADRASGRDGSRPAGELGRQFLGRSLPGVLDRQPGPAGSRWAPPPSPCCPTIGSTRSSGPPSTRPKRRSSTPCSPPAP